MWSVTSLRETVGTVRKKMHISMETVHKEEGKQRQENGNMNMSGVADVDMTDSDGE